MCPNCCSVAQTLPAPPPPLADSYKSSDAIFTNWSGIDVYPGPSKDQFKYSIHYTLCNLDPKKGLFFLWAKPELLTGFTNPLPPGKCMDSTHDSAAFTTDYNAPITFTQSNQSKNASVYLPVYTDSKEATSHLHSWFPNGEQGSTIDFSIHISITQSGETSYTITWSHGTPVIGVSMDVSKDILENIAGTLSKETGVNVDVSYASKMITKDDYSRLSKHATDANYLEFTPPEQGQKKFEFSVKGSNSKPPSGTILFVDDNHQLISSFHYGNL
jgi:hypothetical protein